MHAVLLHQTFSLWRAKEGLQSKESAGLGPVGGLATIRFWLPWPGKPQGGLSSPPSLSGEECPGVLMLPPGVGVLSPDGRSGHEKQATPRAGGRGTAGGLLSKAGGDALEPGGLLCGWSRPPFLGQKFKTEHTALALIFFALCEIWQREPAPRPPGPWDFTSRMNFVK